MKKLIAATLLVFFYTLSVYSNSDRLTKNIIKLVESSRLKNEHLSIIIGDGEGGKIYALNETKKFIPASLTKIVTAAVILEKLPVGHRFVTELKLDFSKVKNGVLTGPIYLVGGGDAGFVSESMWFLVNEFLRNDIKKIDGDVIVDDTRFDQVRFDSSREKERTDRAYDSPIGAMTFNWSAVNVFVRPGNSINEPGRVYVDPETEYFSVVNNSRTVTSGKKTEIAVSNTGWNEKLKKEVLIVNGKIALGGSEFVAYKSVGQPDVWAGSQLIQFLKQRGIEVTGSVRSAHAPAHVNSVATYKSKAIGEQVSDMMKFSNNYIAEILTKNLAYEVKKKTASMEMGVQIIRDHLKANGITDFNIENPSGLSRNNKFRAIDLLKLLNLVKNSFEIYPEFLTGLPIAGVDGTLKRRIKLEQTFGRVRAKTGHLTGVNGLGGYVSDKNGNIFPFIFIFNGSPNDAYKSQDLFDRLLMEVLK